MLWDNQSVSSEGDGVDVLISAANHSVGAACCIVTTMSGDSALPACDALSLGVQFLLFQGLFEPEADCYDPLQHQQLLAQQHNITAINIATPEHHISHV
jgi:hypothetical protein